MNTRTMKLSELIAAPYNPRSISERALKGLQSSIERFGVVQPVIVNERSGHVVGGHQRIKAMIAAGIDETEVVIVDLPEAEEKALNIALNSPAISGEFTEGLKDILLDIEVELPEIYVDLLLEDLAKLPDNMEEEKPTKIKKPITCPECGAEF